jgi:hypothetical protein
VLNCKNISASKLKEVVEKNASTLEKLQISVKLGRGELILGEVVEFPYADVLPKLKHLLSLTVSAAGHVCLLFWFILFVPPLLTFYLQIDLA